MKFYAKALILTVLSAIVALNTLIAQNTTEQYNNHLVECFTIQEFKSLKPSKQSIYYQKYYSNITPLAKKVTLKSNSKEIPYILGEMNYDTYDGVNKKIIGFKPTNAWDRSIFLGWNYLNYYISGTNSNDLKHFISPPSPIEINIGHKNGVKVLGTIDFYWTYSTEIPNTETVFNNLKEFCETPSITASKIYKLTKLYGFDGWLVNNESQSSKAQQYEVTLLEILDTLKKDGLEIIYYNDDSKVNKKSIDYLKNSNGLFVDYGWDSEVVSSGISQVVNERMDPETLYWGINWWTNTHRFFLLNNILTTEVDKKRSSVALYACEFPVTGPQKGVKPQTAKSSTDLFVGMWFNNGNTPNLSNNTLNAVGNYATPKTAITSLPFKTNFNIGKGSSTFKKGKEILPAAAWGKLKHQDILPYYMYNKNDCLVTFDLTTAWKGGSSLKIENNSNDSQIIPIYLTKIDLSKNDSFIGMAKLKVVFSSASKKQNFSLMLDTIKGQQIDFDLSKNRIIENGYRKSKHIIQGQYTITGISIRVPANSEINLGEIALLVPDKI